ncbi:MAG: nitroreductase family protein [Candidatus Thermoplasmatota archaeon]|nr:nitroreductase family protein [Candidatus Thermoplasmatota archaeon]
MELDEVMEQRRSFRALDGMEMTDDMVTDLAEAASLSPSCANNQPWRFVFVRKGPQLDLLLGTLSGGNYWARKASMVAAVITKPELDCRNEEGDYHWFDTGMATGLLLLKATEMGLLTHPIAGFDQKAARKVLEVPEGYELLTLIIFGKRSMDLSGLSEKHQKQETTRPERLPLEKIAFMERFQGE